MILKKRKQKTEILHVNRNKQIANDFLIYIYFI